MWSIFILKHPCRAANFGGGLALATPVFTAGEVHFSNTGPADRWGLRTPWSATQKEEQVLYLYPETKAEWIDDVVLF